MAGRPFLISSPNCGTNGHLNVLEPLTGRSASYVVRVRTADNRDAVLNVPIPSEDIASQVRTIRSAHGRGRPGAEGSGVRLCVRRS